MAEMSCFKLQGILNKEEKNLDKWYMIGVDFSCMNQPYFCQRHIKVNVNVH